MALPVRTDCVLIPVAQYPPGQPPFVPNIQVDQQIAPLLAEITSAIINELGQKAYANPARIFIYNMMVSNFFNNQQFIDVVKLVTDALLLNASKGLIPNPYQGLYDTVNQIITLVSSNALFEYPELKSICAPALVEAAMQNAQVFNNMKQEIFAMHNQHHRQPQYPHHPQPPQYHQPQYPQPPQYPAPQYPQPPQYQNQQQYPQPPQYPHQGHYPQPPQYPRLVPQPFQVQQQNLGGGRWTSQHAVSGDTVQSFGNNSQPQASATDQSRFFSRTVNSEAVETTFTAPENFVAAPSEKDWKSTLSQPYRTLVTNQFKKHYRISGPDASVFEIIEQDNTMDRSKHALVLDSYQLKPERVVQVEHAVETLRLVTKTVDDPIDYNEYIRKTWYADSFLSPAIFEGKLQQALHAEKDDGCEVFRFYTTVLNPVITNQDTTAICAELHAAPSFVAIARKMKSISMAAEQLNGGNKLPSEIVYLMKVDKMLTELINEFLTHKLSLSKLSIESFVDDIASLSGYLESKYGEIYSTALAKYETDTISSLFFPVDESIGSVACETLSDGEPDINISFIPVNYSITYLNLLDKELGIKMKACDCEALLIAEGVTPMLFKVAESLYMNQNELEASTLHNLLITQDDFVYKIHRGYLGRDCFLLSRVL